MKFNDLVQQMIEELVEASPTDIIHIVDDYAPKLYKKAYTYGEADGENMAWEENCLESKQEGYVNGYKEGFTEGWGRAIDSL